MNCLRTGRLLMVISAKGLTISFMEKRAPGGRPKNRGADYSGNCSTFDQKQFRAPSSTKLVPEVFSRHRLGAYFCSKNRRSPREPCAAGFLPSFGPWHTNCSLVRQPGLADYRARLCTDSRGWPSRPHPPGGHHVEVASTD